VLTLTIILLDIITGDVSITDTRRY